MYLDPLTSLQIPDDDSNPNFFFAEQVSLTAQELKENTCFLPSQADEANCVESNTCREELRILYLNFEQT